MSHYNWCHNPDCHTIRTQSRIRGSGDNKVLRTVKIKVAGITTTMMIVQVSGIIFVTTIVCFLF